MCGFLIALILGGDFFTGAVLATALTKLVLRFNELTSDGTAWNILRAEVRLPLFSEDGCPDRSFTIGYANHDLHYPCRTIEIRDCVNRRGLA